MTLTPEDRAEMQTFLNEAMTSGLRGAFQEFRGHFQEQLSPIAARLDAFEATPNPSTANAPSGEPATPDAQTHALMERLAKMEKQELDRQAELKAYKFQGELGSNIGKHSPIHSEIVKELLSSRYGNSAVEKDGQWYLPNGSKLSEDVESFFKSDAGQHFMANPSGKSAGVVTSSTAVPQGTAGLTAEQMMADFSF